MSVRDPASQNNLVISSTDKADFLEEGPTENLLDPNQKISAADFEYIKVIGRGAFAKVLLVR